MSTWRKHLAALAAVSILAACGGGGGTEGASTPEAVITALRTQVDALRNVAPAEAARQLMDFGETRFRDYFPTHEQTQSEPPFAYRHYPSTGAYLGVVVTPGSGFVMNGVYVMGGPFGAAPQYVGLLSDFITPVDSPAATGNGCFDLNLAQTENTRIVANYSVTGSMTGTMQIDTLVGAPTTFGTQQALLTTVTTTGSGTTAEGSATINNSMKLYSSVPGVTPVTQYGQEFVTSALSSGFTLTTTNRTVWNPPYADPQYTLALGESATSTLNGTLSTTVSMPGLPSVPSSTTAISQTSTTKYVGRETTTVPAGTYETCKFDVTTTSGTSTSVVSNWVIVGKGIPVRTQATDQITTATSITVNGAAL